MVIGVQLAEEGAQDGGLARSHFADQGDEPGAVVDAVEKVGKGFLVGLAQEDKTRVGGQIKRLFPEAVKVEVY